MLEGYFAAQPDPRRAGASLVAALALLPLALAGCGGSGKLSLSSTKRCLLGIEGVEALVRTVGNQHFVRFSDGSAVGIVFARSADEAAWLAPASAGPGDPYAYEAFGNAVLAWGGEPDDPRLKAVEGCLR